jgi:hypothetical protein
MAKRRTSARSADVSRGSSVRNVTAAVSAASARRERKEKMANEVVQYTQDQVDQIVLAAVVQATGRLNGYPVHVHKCTKSNHPWFCSSPYCEDVNSNPALLCENHGGRPTIQRGMEPWRGGNR